MKVQQVVKELEQAVRELGVPVRREKGSFRGGLCVRNDETLMMLNKNQPAEAHLAVLARALQTLPVDSVYLKPAVRKVLEDAWAAAVDVELQEEADG
ncbi:MAG: hypothetical protein JJ896_07730 [Rhodothermales bacterium]|nr:hypothetical protein [Rhodothermales bacterium]MBO6779529.1 hypothetical protein [Rhodothermales bacterium]